MLFSGAAALLSVRPTTVLTLGPPGHVMTATLWEELCQLRVMDKDHLLGHTYLEANWIKSAAPTVEPN